MCGASRWTGPPSTPTMRAARSPCPPIPSNASASGSNRRSVRRPRLPRTTGGANGCTRSSGRKNRLASFPIGTARGAQRIGSEAQPIGLEAGMLWGLGRAIALEHPELHCRCVDLDPARDPSDADLASLIDRASTADADENQIALRGGDHFVLRLARGSSADALVNAGPVYRADSSYLV